MSVLLNTEFHFLSFTFNIDLEHEKNKINITYIARTKINKKLEWKKVKIALNFKEKYI